MIGSLPLEFRLHPLGTVTREAMLNYLIQPLIYLTVLSLQGNIFTYMEGSVLTVLQPVMILGDMRFPMDH
jgi:hypothetical protein